jgi:ammonia channel protein AmtB
MTSGVIPSTLVRMSAALNAISQTNAKKTLSCFLLMSGARVMWMATGFAMLESGMVRTKSVAEILTKNIALYAIACVMYMLVGYNIM